jgi:hypothetical protein
MVLSGMCRRRGDSAGKAQRVPANSQRAARQVRSQTHPSASEGCAKCGVSRAVHARAVTSGFARMPADVVERAVEALRSDLVNGYLDAQHGYLRSLEEHDVGLRSIVASP